MGTLIEFNHILALRENGTIGFPTSETVPPSPTPGVSYIFLKKGQRAFSIDSLLPLVVTTGDCQFTRLVGFIKIHSYTVAVSDVYSVATGGYYEFVRAASQVESDFYLNLGKESVSV